MASNGHRTIHERYIADLNAGSLGFADELFADDYVEHGLGGEVRGAAGYKQAMQSFLDAFPGAQFSIEESIEQDDRVMSRWTMRGAHRGTFQGIAPTGNEVSVPGMTITRVADGKVAEEWEQIDLATLYKQLWALPSE